VGATSRWGGLEVECSGGDLAVGQKTVVGDDLFIANRGDKPAGIRGNPTSLS
jgi:hypothetical protein